MLFPTTDFAIFICVVFAANWLLMPQRLPWKLFMIAASYVFYAWWDPGLVWLLAAVSALAQIGGLLVSGAERALRKRYAVAIGVAITIAPLLWFKYYAFFSVTASNALGAVGIGSPFPLLQVVLPVGISFYTFMAISYVVDIYRNDTTPASTIDLFLYLSFFPHLVAGPIVRPNELIPQFAQAKDPKAIDVPHAAWLIFRGLFKKVVISSFLASELVDPVFGDPGAASGAETLLAIYAYAVVIYADFSGYTDIAIGIAELLGFRFPENFDRPYAARSLQDFWRRWHITLSRWLRDYLYVPLGGSRQTEPRIYFNILATMLLGGLWHGAGWTFIAWGAIHGLGQIGGRVKRAYFPQLAERDGVLDRIRQRVITFHVVCFAWIFFRAPSLDDAGAVLGRLIGGWGQPSPSLTWLIGLTVAGALIAQLIRGDALAPWRRATAESFRQMRPVVQGSLLGGALFLTTTLAPEGVAPFIYFRF